MAAVTSGIHPYTIVSKADISCLIIFQILHMSKYIYVCTHMYIHIHILHHVYSLQYLLFLISCVSHAFPIPNLISGYKIAC